MKKIRLATVIGTRPEAVKMAPIIRLLHQRPAVFEPLVISTSQHRELLTQMFTAFGIQVHVDLDLMQPNQGLSEFASRSLSALSTCLSQHKPDMILVQGDTTTVVTAALAAFHQKIPVGHVEAGLRSFNMQDPFPEEANRRLTASLASLHFAPTLTSRRNLLCEGIAEESIFVTGNTVVDALQMLDLDDAFDSPALQQLNFTGKRVILVTAHRRENHGEPLQQICAALNRLTSRFSDVCVVFPVHPHPAVRAIVDKELAGNANIHRLDPVSYPDLLRLLRLSYLIMTDSGGIQEEAPSFGKPVLILRETTERPELVDAGGAQLVGTRVERILFAATELLGNKQAYRAMRMDCNPFGDGNAAASILDTVENHFAGLCRMSGESMGRCLDWKTPAQPGFSRACGLRAASHGQNAQSDHQ